MVFSAPPNFRHISTARISKLTSHH